MMRRLVFALSFALAATAAFAHAQLDSASPPVGGSAPSPSEIRLKFTEALEPRFSSFTVSAASGQTEKLGPVGLDPSDAAIMLAKVPKALAAGVYTVKWRAVSVDTHHTQGSFDFTVRP